MIKKILFLIAVLPGCAPIPVVVVDVASTQKAVFEVRLSDKEVRDALGDLTTDARKTFQRLADEARQRSEVLDVIVPRAACGVMIRNFSWERTLSSIDKNIYSACAETPSNDWILRSVKPDKSVRSKRYHE
jgi:hypothetical protein